MTAPFKKLDEFIDHLRSKGVLAYKGALIGTDAEVEMTLLPNEPQKPEKESKKKAEELFEPKKKGADGCDAEMQKALYGAVLDAEE